MHFGNSRIREFQKWAQWRLALGTSCGEDGRVGFCCGRVVDMDETAFQAARLCQVLGGTTRYRILKLLAGEPMTPGQLCKALGKRPNVISDHLGKLRNAGLVRFKRTSDGLMYWPKVKGIGGLLRSVEQFVVRAGAAKG
jgi:DNA-binding transcriptional ArsR family regulator